MHKATGTISTGCNLTNLLTALNWHTTVCHKLVRNSRYALQTSLNAGPLNFT